MQTSAKFALAIVLLSGAAAGQALPDPRLTPGVIRTSDAAEICAPSFRTAPFRKTTAAMKRRVCLAYGRTRDCPGTPQEIDHLVPLELGGNDVEANLWPQPYRPAPGAHQKDLVENRLHKMVCAGEITLPEAQAMLIRDWRIAYRKLGFGKTK